MGRIIRLGEIEKYIKPKTATVVGGVFDLFHVGHLRYLKECSEFGRPLVVIVQSDKAVSYRKGLDRPIIRQNDRAEIISSLEFVDYILVLPRPSHYESYLKVIQPKNLVFSKENVKHRLVRKKILEKQFPGIQVSFLSRAVRCTGTSQIIERIKNTRSYKEIKDPVIKRLYKLSEKSRARAGKISAFITYKEKVVAESGNNEKKDLHAETMAIKEAQTKGIPLDKSKIYILIPPCIVCAKAILEAGIPEVYYLNPYGNDDGMQLLRKKGIKVRKYKNQEK